MSEVVILPAEPSDLEFIYRTWTQSGRRSKTPLSGERVFSRYVLGETMKGILSLPSTHIEKVVHPKSPDVPLAWMATEDWQERWLVIYFGFTAKPFRELGFARALVDHARGDLPMVCLCSGTKMWQKDYTSERTDWRFDYDFLQQRLIYEQALERANG